MFLGHHVCRTEIKPSNKSTVNFSILNQFLGKRNELYMYEIEKGYRNFYRKKSFIEELQKVGMTLNKISQI